MHILCGLPQDTDPFVWVVYFNQKKGTFTVECEEKLCMRKGQLRPHLFARN